MITIPFLPGDLCRVDSKQHLRKLFVVSGWHYAKRGEEGTGGPYLSLYGDVTYVVGAVVYMCRVKSETPERCICMVLHEGGIGYAWESNMEKMNDGMLVEIINGDLQQL